MRRTTPSSLLSGAALLCAAAVVGGCQTTSFNILEPDFVVDPDVVAFGTVTGGLAGEQEVRVFNLGEGRGEVTDIRLAGRNPDLVLADWGDEEPFDPAQGRDVEGQSGFTFGLSWRPLDETELDELLIVETENGQVFEVPITGTPNIEPVPDIYCDPPFWDAGRVNFGDMEGQTLWCGNRGWSTLDVGQVQITGPGAANFSLRQNDVSWNTFEPESDPARILVAFEPLADGFHEAQLEIYSREPNADPDSNPLIVPLSGRGDNAPLAKPPHPECGAVIGAVVDELVFLDGSQSWDPQGAVPLSYHWELIAAPSGSLATLQNADAVNPWLVPDLAGSYTARLSVTNALGVPSNDTCDATVRVSSPLLQDPDPGDPGDPCPPEDGEPNFLLVSLSWAVPEDLDLHLLRTPDAEIASDDDCWGVNCSPTHGFHPIDWWDFVPGADDPIMDRDDFSGFGTGPENIIIYEPRPGSYPVIVNDFVSAPSGRHDFLGPNGASVVIMRGSEVLGTYNFPMEGEGDCYHVATIHWPPPPEPEEEEDTGPPKDPCAESEAPPPPEVIVEPGPGSIGQCMGTDWIKPGVILGG